MERRLLWFVVLGILTLTYACNNKRQETADSLSVVSSFWAEDGNRSAYQELYQGFEEKYGIKIEDLSEESTNEWKNKVVEQFDNGEESDVCFFYSGGASDPIINNKKVVSIDEIRSKYPNYASNINASVLNSMKSKDGNAYAIPVTGFWEGLFVNKDVFEECGVEIPTEWEDFITAIRSFQENGIVPIAVSLSDIPHYMFEYFIYNFTGPSSHLQSVPTEPDNIPESWLKGLSLFKEFYDMGAFPENVNHTTNDEIFQMFQDKKAAMLLDGSWMVGRMKDVKNVAVVPFPAMEGQPRKNTDMIAGFSMGFYITKKAWEDPAKQEAAVNFISHMTSNDAIERFNVGVVTPSISTREPEAAENPLLQSVVDLNEHSTAYIGAVQDAFKQEAQTRLLESIPLIAAGEVTPEEAIREFIITNNEPE